jgi:hypothetical protein
MRDSSAAIFTTRKGRYETRTAGNPMISSHARRQFIATLPAATGKRRGFKDSHAFLTCSHNSHSYLHFSSAFTPAVTEFTFMGRAIL